jgi:DNA-directed RNA polymerase beta subunit
MDEPIIRDGSDAPAAATPTPSLADKAPAVLRAYFNSTPTFLTQHHIDTYEAAIFREIPEIILSENPIVVLKEPIKEAVGLYKYKTEIFVGGDVGSISQLNIDVGPPIITLDGGKTVRRMFANEARLRNLTYASQFRADILIRLTFTSIDESGEITTMPVPSSCAKWASVPMIRAATSSSTAPRRS